MKKNKLIILPFIFINTLAWALTCPPNNAPLCPDSGTTLLDDTYPVQAFVMSNSSFKRPPTRESKNVTRNYIHSIINSYDFKDVPQIMLAVSTEAEFESYKKTIQEDLEKKKIPSEQIDKIISQLTHLKSPNYTWQQDYFESFVNLSTGKPEVRHIDSYSRVHRSTTSTMAQIGESCGMAEGSSIKTDYGSTGNGEMGGNIEGAPGGFCLVGNNQGAEFTKSFCGKEENIINLQVSWLAVGHVDEIFKIVPNYAADGRPRECQFSLMAASPDKAMDLLKDPKYANRPFFDFSAKNDTEELNDLRDSRSNIYERTNKKLCDYITQAAKENPRTKKSQEGEKGKTVWLDIIMSKAHAAARVVGSNLKTDCMSNVTEIPNSQMREQFLKDKETVELNRLIQESINKDKLLIKAKILSRLPQCKPYFDTIDVPNYFEGGPLIEDDATGKKVLPKQGYVNAFLPNPTNSVLMNKTLLFPDAGNSAYNDFLTEEMKKRKINSDFIPTWDYAHLGQGNIHCSSHSIPYCKPRGQN